MKIRTPITRITMTVTAVVIVMFCIYPEVCCNVGLDFWSDKADETELLENRAKSARMDVTNNSAVKRLSLKMEIIENLVDGRVSLQQVNEQFIALNRTGDDITEIVCKNFPGKSLEDSTRKHVMAFVCARVKTFPAQRQEEVLARLRRELKELVLAEENTPSIAATFAETDE